MAKKTIPPKAPTRKATPAAKSVQAAAPKKTVAKPAPKPVTGKTAAAKPASRPVVKKASVKSVRKETVPSVVAKPAARKCASKMASPACGKKVAAAKPAGISAVAAKGAAKSAAKTATKPVVKGAVKSSVKPAAKPVAKSAAKPVVKSAAKPVARPVASKAKVSKAVPVKVETKKAVKKSVPAPKKGVAARPVGNPKAVVLKKPTTPAANNKTVKVAPVATRKVSEMNVPKELRRAFGSYDGIVVCEHPGHFPEKTPYTEKELAAIQKLLHERRRHLLEVLRELDDKTFSNTLDSGKAYHSTANTHLFEGASDNMASDMALMVRKEEEMALTQVEAALERLEEGLFGVCVACGDKIGIPRLKAKPEAHLCINCKTVYDKKSRLR